MPVMPMIIPWSVAIRRSVVILEPAAMKHGGFFQNSAFPVQLGKKPGLLGLIFRKAQNKVQDPAKLRRLIGGPDRQRRMAI